MYLHRIYRASLYPFMRCEITFGYAANIVLCVVVVVNPESGCNTLADGGAHDGRRHAVHGRRHWSSKSQRIRWRGHCVTLCVCGHWHNFEKSKNTACTNDSNVRACLCVRTRVGVECVRVCVCVRVPQFPQISPPNYTRFTKVDLWVTIT